MKYLLLYAVESLICVSRRWYYSKTIPYKITADSKQEKLYSSLQRTQTRRVTYQKLEWVFRHNKIDPKNNHNIVQDTVYSKQY